MKRNLLFCLILIAQIGFSQTRNIHVFVALCDNANQGIVPVPVKLGNGQDPNNNLYWGAMYGIESFFKNKSEDWMLVQTIKSNDPKILDALLFLHRTERTYLLAEAYDGKHIKKCTEDFLLAANGQNEKLITHHGQQVKFGGSAGLVAYIGHDGLMEFQVELEYEERTKPKDAIMLACVSESYFRDDIKKANANPILWTTGLMAPEAYTLEAAIKGWLEGEDGESIKERGAQAYNKYQKCGINGARRLFSTGF